MLVDKPPAERSVQVDMTQATDVFTYGIILLELFCGVVTWESVTGPGGVWSELRIRANQDTARPVLRPLEALHLPKSLELLVSQCTCWLPEDRPTFAEIVRTLRDPGLGAALQLDRSPGPTAGASFSQARARAATC